ncbi:hypothetical protein DW929_07760, partial [Eubacterium ventriosum]
QRLIASEQTTSFRRGGDFCKGSKKNQITIPYQVTISKFRKVVFFCHGYKLHRFNYFIVWLKKYPNITSQK